jgi:glutamate N-acetyltransferase/amino-acid N-acetyltransferase
VAQAAAALFTTNRVVAAPVEVGRASLLSSGGRVRAVVVNSGNANCATGRAGIQACERVCREAGKLFGVPADESFHLRPASSECVSRRRRFRQVAGTARGAIGSQRGVQAFANAIMTTDTRPKIASARFRVGLERSHRSGNRQGRGHDPSADGDDAGVLVHRRGSLREELQATLREACDNSLNCISIDGDTSTNDTVLLLASGASGALERCGRAKEIVLRL